MSDPSLLAAGIWLAIAAIIAVVLFITSYFVKPAKRKKKDKQHVGNIQNERVGGHRRRRGADMMRRRVLELEDDEEDEDIDDFGSLPFDPNETTGKIGAKKMKKLEMKAKKSAKRGRYKTCLEEMEYEREERKQRQRMLDDEAKRLEKIRKKEKEKEEEEERKRKEEQERLEHEEYLKLKESFAVEGEGSGEQLIEEESQSLLQEFIDYIKDTKVVLLEDLASHFNLRTQDAINRVKVLQEMGRITGVVDDRGKFIYISQEELEAVAKFIQQRGRVSISDLSDSSNTLINLEACLKKPEMSSTEIPV
ncbi:DDRGK domain-containing protein 1-like [Xenia sp. Carnegie-2017]|uniref:DDRGK domain-containing protein 1-like n=1 Tax=Xenia sp. Carnegie-2017 TaxID=2897299 RepID=UPI001F04027B|nr:DDRGK domain-containing protein 1-like [Xenia sp. Carnegie-2017]